MANKRQNRKIKALSKSRVSKLPDYKLIHIDFELMKSKGQLFCFFSGEQIKYDFDKHHLDGRDGDSFSNKDYIVPVLRKYHTEYHSLSIAGLLKTKWYNNFLNNVKQKSEKLWKKEINKQYKAGIITISEYNTLTSQE